MAKTVGEGIQELLERLEPSTAEVQKRQTHRQTIESALSGEFRKVNRVEVIGSHTRSAAIHIFSDVDYFAMLSVDDVTRGGARVSSTTTLERTKKALQTRFQSTQVWVDGPAVVVGFGQGSGAVDVVPGVWIGMTQSSPQYPIYEIPDGAGGWLRTSPQRHGKYIRDEDSRAQSKLSRTVQLLKAWKYSRSPKVPVLGFHLELLLAAEKTCVGVKSYQNCLLDAFRLLKSRNGKAMNDPLGISSRIPATATDAQRQALVGAAAHAADKAERAITAELAGKLADAFGYWDLVFNGNFPTR